MFKNLIVFDAVANDIHGRVFCVGATLVDPKGNVLDRFIGRTHIQDAFRPWVVKNVLPAIVHIPLNCANEMIMAHQFLNWLDNAVQMHDAAVFTDCRHPVDSAFLVNAVRNTRRSINHPIHEVATVLVLAGLRDDESRYEFVAEELPGVTPQKHNPVWDSEVSAKATAKALRMLAIMRADSEAAFEANTSKSQFVLNSLDVKVEVENAQIGSQVGSEIGSNQVGKTAAHAGSGSASSGSGNLSSDSKPHGNSSAVSAAVHNTDYPDCG